MTSPHVAGARSAPASLFSFWHDVAPEVEAELNLYLDFDHIPDRLSCDGWGTAERFARSNVPLRDLAVPKLSSYLYLHELRSPTDATSSARDAFAAGSAWSRWQRELREEGAVIPDSSVRRTWRIQDEGSAGVSSHVLPPPRVLFAWIHGPIPVRAPLSAMGTLRWCRYVAAGAGAEEVAPGESTLDLIDLATPEIVRTQQFAQWLSEIADATGAELDAAVYVQRPSPWLARPMYE